MQYPKPFESLIECFRRLPGVGAKTAERYAFKILELRENEIQSFIEALDSSFHKIHKCVECGNLTINDKCDICLDTNRDHSTICVVTQAKDILAFEKTGEYHGVYHVLDGEVSTSKGILPSDIRIDELLQRIDDSIKEVIIATNPTMDGETTALYIAKLLGNYPATVSRLAHGLPMGGYVDYADELTLIKAMEGRNKIK